MVEKIVKYKDFNGEEHTETFRFHLKKLELAEMGFEKGEGFEEKLKNMIKEKDQLKLYRLFREFILKAYGVKSEDGLRFMKSEELSKAFEESNAYDELVLELMGNGEEAANFLKGMLPDDLEATLEKIEKK